MSITLDLNDQALALLPLQPGERERLMQIELACRFYARGWLSLGRAARMAKLDRFAFGLKLAERDIPRQYSLDDLDVDVRYAEEKRQTMVCR
jgi:predicted HTH domain antitoxin